MRKVMVFILIIIFGILWTSCSEDCPTCPDSENNGVSIAIQHYDDVYITRVNCKVLVTDNKGNPLPNKRVDWEIIKGEGHLTKQTSVTTDDGTSEIQVQNITSTELQLRISVFGYNASVTITSYKST